MKSKWTIVGSILAVLLLALAVGPGQAQGPQPPGEVGIQSALGTAFTYQGQLKKGGSPVNDTCDLRFILYDANVGGSQVGPIQEKTGVNVANGYLTIPNLDFGSSAFTGEARWLEIAVKCAGDADYVTLSQRQPLTPAPYALFSKAAPWSGLSGMPAGFADNTDNDTTYTAGTGLTLTGNQFSVNTAAIQTRVSGTCAAGNAIRAINADGTVTCEADDNTTYTAGDGLELSGTQFRMKGTSYQNVIIVAKSGGDFSSIQAALNSITDAGSDNRYLVWVAPGTYNERVTMKPYVDIEGAGELVTKITYSGSASINSGTVLGANDAELRDLAVENTGGADYAIAIYNSSASPRLTQLMVVAQGGTFNFGIYNSSSATPKLTNVTVTATGGSYTYGMYNISSSPVMVNVVISATLATSNRGVYSDFSTLTLTNVTIEAGGGSDSRGIYNYNTSPSIYSSVIKATSGSNTYGIYNYNASMATSMVVNGSQISGNQYGFYISGSGSYTPTVSINNSQISGSTNALYNGANSVTRIGASQLSGGPVSVGSGTVTCAGVYDENYAFYASTCP